LPSLTGKLILNRCRPILHRSKSRSGQRHFIVAFRAKRQVGRPIRETMPIEIFIDADACPVKDEIYRVADRYGLKVYVVANAPIRIPRIPTIEQIVVGADPDAADDWIAARARQASIVVTSDIPLASRCIKTGAEVLTSTGRRFTEASIGMALATRNLMDHLRSTGDTTSGPKAFTPRDRSNFLGALDNAVVRLQRAGFG
jgi:uncharacterized protein YaiI (UPF0178 family)